MTADHLGTTRVITDTSKAVLECRDYLPFGDELLATAQNGRSGIACYSGETGLRQEFTGKERDAESRLDYFGARYYSWAAGRFTSPDEPFADQFLDDPQSWNLYGYGRNNPLIFADPTGQKCVKTDDGNPADDGDGTGCKEAGVSPSTEEQRQRGEDIEPYETNARERSPWLQAAMDFSAGTGNELSFGASGALMEWAGKGYQVNPCSTAYASGEWTAFAGIVAGSGGAGFLKSGIKKAGTEFSHFIPKTVGRRIGGRIGGFIKSNNPLNGNYVSLARHYRHDPNRFPSRTIQKAVGDKYPPALGTLDRTPDWLKGAAIGAAYGGTSMVMTSGGCPAN